MNCKLIIRITDEQDGSGTVYTSGSQRGRLLASGGRCKGRGVVGGAEKRGGGRGALNENLFKHI